MTLMKELIHIPEKVQRGDFVLNLATGLEADAIEQTLKDYVVTPELAKCFEDALSFIKSTVTSHQNRNKGAYLHGSFGSGKSHFMAVLHLLLQQNTQARAIPELASAVSKHDDWMQSKNILLVPYHMIGAPSIEAGILGGYARYIAKRHPDAPVPGFYMSEHLFKDAIDLRSHMGDNSFFAALNTNSSALAADDEWGELATGWNSASFDAVVTGQSSEEDKTRLVGDLIDSLFKSYSQMASANEGSYVDFDDGLRIMTQHAKALGYDAVILFLDELILWLASRLTDQRFINTEIQKVVKLVETGIPRELPVISFIARQRDLREFVGDQYSGAEQEILSDSLKYWEGRFHTITLEDRNLPVIAQRRLLRPLNEAAKAQIEQAFSKTEKMREESFNLLLTSKGDRNIFRNLYPFSPALMHALVALSSALQRDRTALKVMLMLLVEQRDTLELGNVIPVGDLYDVVASEAEPFSEQMRHHFENAKVLFERKLIPLLESEHNVTVATLNDPATKASARLGFNNDIRLLKTLLLAALVPEVESFKQLTAAKLAALNHGTIKSPIPGREAQTVLQKCRKWAGQVGEVKLSDDSSNPTIGIQLSGVDTESIIELGRTNDNEGNRRRLVKQMVFEAFGIRDENQLFIEHEFVWRGTRRRVAIVFQNIREITDFSLFESRGDEWKIIIDFPFDTGTHSPTDDQGVVRNFLSQGGQAQTLCWLPYFFSETVKKNLGKLVILQEILKSDDSYNRYSGHLTPQDRASARSLLDNQRSQLTQQLKDQLMGAYGVSEPQQGSLDNSDTLQSQVMSLQPGFNPRLPQGATMDKAFSQLLGQALSFQYPDHPEFETEVTLTHLGKVLGELLRAIHAENGRIDVDSPLRPLMRQIAQPLNLGDMHERHFIFKQDWPQHLARELAKQGVEDITVAALREVMNQPNPKGLPLIVQNLLIMVFAEQGQYAYHLHGGPFSGVVLKEVRDELVLIKQELAEPQQWKSALDKVGLLLGVSVSSLRTASNQNDLEKKVTESASRYLSHCSSLAAELEKQLLALNLPLDCNRFKNAQLAVTVLEGLQDKKGVELVDVLASINAVTSIEALATGIKTAERVHNSLEDNNWALLSSVWKANTDEGNALKNRLADALSSDELVIRLSEALREAQSQATNIITRKDPEPAIPPEVKPPKGRKVLCREARKDLSVNDANDVLADIKSQLKEGVTLDISYSILGEED